MLQDTQWTQFAESWMDWAGLFGAARNYNRLAVALAEHDQMTQPWASYIEFARRYTAHYHEMRNQRLIDYREFLEIRGFRFTFNGEEWLGKAAGIEFSSPTLAGVLKAADEWAIPLKAQWLQKARQAVRLKNGGLL